MNNINPYECINLTYQDAIATVTLNRPEVRNAFNEQLIAELTQVFTLLSESPTVRVVILAANGSVFCAGADLNWMRKMADYSHADNLNDARGLAKMLHVMDGCSKPIIAKVQGDVYAGGMGLISVCDIVVASENANFCLSETRLGLVPATISPYVIRAMGVQASRRYFLTAEVFNAQRAMHIGLLHECVNAEALSTTVTQIAQTLCKNSPAATSACKRLLSEMSNQTLSAELRERTAEWIAEIRASEEGREGVQAFLAKRKPSWLQ